MIDQLKKLGFKDREARILDYLFKHKSCTMRNIELDLVIRQPEVSITIKKFKDLGWVNIERKKCKGKGRPFYVLTLNESKVKKDILDFINKSIKELQKVKKELKWK